MSRRKIEEWREKRNAKKFALRHLVGEEGLIHLIYKSDPMPDAETMQLAVEVLEEIKTGKFSKRWGRDPKLLRGDQ